MAIYPPNKTTPKGLNYPWNYLGSTIKDFAIKLASYIGLNDLNSTELPLTPGTYGPKVSFKKSNYGSEVDVIIPGVLEITRGNNQGIFNIAQESNYSSGSPVYTEWNCSFTDPNLSGWALACNAFGLPYKSWQDSLTTNSWGPMAIAQANQKLQMIMHETTTDRYWLIQFNQWTPGGNGGGFAYDRWEIFPKVEFVRPSLQPDVVDVITFGKTIIKRDNNKGIYNVAVENEYVQQYPKSPYGTLWNSQYTDSRSGYSGWANLSNVKNRRFEPWVNAVNGNPPNSVTDDLELVMLDEATGFYYTVQFTNWGVGPNNGAVSYTRRLIPLTKSIDFAGGPGVGIGGSLDYNNANSINYNTNNIKVYDSLMSGPYTLSEGDQGTMIIMTNDTVINIPALRLPIGAQVDIINNSGGVGGVVFSSAGPTILSDSGLFTLNTQYTAATLIYTAKDTWTLIGKLS